MVTLLWKMVWNFLKKIKNRAITLSRISTPGYIFTRIETRISRAWTEGSAFKSKYCFYRDPELSGTQPPATPTPSI